MIELAVAMFWAMLVAWLILRAYRQFLAYRMLQPESGRPAADMPDVSVIVPARNEGDLIGRCLLGLKAQDYAAERTQIIVVDDGSTDATATLAQHAAAGDPRLTVVKAGPLPPGWMGKSHACWQGVALARGAWFCFIDADTKPQPSLLRTAIAAAERHGLDLLSLQPMQELGTPWERLIIPAGLFALSFARDLRRIDWHDFADCAINGQFILVRRAVYERIGGHSEVRATVAEDSALAGRVKAAGGRIALWGGASLISVRMYRNVGQLWEGLSKNVIETFGGVPATLRMLVLGVPLAWASLGIPIFLAASLGRPPSPLHAGALALASLASLAAFGVHLRGARYFAIPVWYGLLFPVGYSLGALLVINGIRERWRGRVVWKGRAYPADSPYSLSVKASTRR